MKRPSNTNHPFSHEKTILDEIKLHNYLKGKGKKNPSIPSGGSIPSPKPPPLTIDHTICDNGARRPPIYRLGGRRVNAQGFGLQKQDLKAIEKMSCKGCNGFRCDAKSFSSVSTAQPFNLPNPKNRFGFGQKSKMFPKSSPYFMGPLPNSNYTPKRPPQSFTLPDDSQGQIYSEYIEYCTYSDNE
jgi:hypothetical protein